MSTIRVARTPLARRPPCAPATSWRWPGCSRATARPRWPGHAVHFIARADSPPLWAIARSANIMGHQRRNVVVCDLFDRTVETAFSAGNWRRRPRCPDRGSAPRSNGRHTTAPASQRATALTGSARTGCADARSTAPRSQRCRTRKTAEHQQPGFRPPPPAPARAGVASPAPPLAAQRGHHQGLQARQRWRTRWRSCAPPSAQAPASQLRRRLRDARQFGGLVAARTRRAALFGIAVQPVWRDVGCVGLQHRHGVRQRGCQLARSGAPARRSSRRQSRAASRARRSPGLAASCR